MSGLTVRLAATGTWALVPIGRAAGAIGRIICALCAWRQAGTLPISPAIRAISRSDMPNITALSSTGMPA